MKNAASEPLIRPACGLCCTILENFGVKYQEHTALQGIHLHIHCGDLTAIIGPNGAGKSTLFKAMLGELPHSGRLYYLDAENQRAGKPIIGYVPQKLDFDPTIPLTVNDFFASVQGKWPVWMGMPAGRRQHTMDLLARVEAAHLINRKLGELSGGELQRVLLAMALEPVPDLLLLDEPVTGVDVHGMKLFYQMLNDFRHSYDLSIIIISHELGLLSKYADRVILLNKTILASGTALEVFADPQFAAHFGTALTPGGPDYFIREEDLV